MDRLWFLYFKLYILRSSKMFEMRLDVSGRITNPTQCHNYSGAGDPGVDLCSSIMSMNVLRCSKFNNDNYVVK